HAHRRVAHEAADHRRRVAGRVADRREDLAGVGQGQVDGAAGLRRVVARVVDYRGVRTVLHRARQRDVHRELRAISGLDVVHPGLQLLAAIEVRRWQAVLDAPDAERGAAVTGGDVDDAVPISRGNQSEDQATQVVGGAAG